MIEPAIRQQPPRSLATKLFGYGMSRHHAPRYPCSQPNQAAEVKCECAVVPLPQKCVLIEISGDARNTRMIAKTNRCATWQIIHQSGSGHWRASVRLGVARNMPIRIRDRALFSPRPPPAAVVRRGRGNRFETTPSVYHYKIAASTALHAARSAFGDDDRMVAMIHTA